MKALLVNPWITDFAAYDFWLKPLGLLYVGAYLKRMGFEVHLIDLLNRHDPQLKKYVNVPKDKFYRTGKFPHLEINKPDVLSFMPRIYKRYGAPDKYFLDKLAKIGEVDIILVTSTLTYWYPGYWKTIEFLNNYYEKKVPIIFGGFYVRNLPSHAKKAKAVIFSGNDLNRLPRILEQLLNKNFKCENIDWFEELDPAYDLYSKDSKVGYLVFTTTIGCPYKCTYCIAHRMWNGMRFRTVKKVVDSIEKFAEMFQVKDIVFFDDAILVNSKNHFNLILKEIISRNLKLNFHLPNGIHAKLVNEETVELMKEANFKTIKLGYETTGELQLKTGGKVIDRDLINAARIFRKFGFTEKEVSAYIMVNIPGQKVKDVVEAMKICKNEGIDFSINEFTPIIGTDDWIDLINQGKLTGMEDPVLLNNTVLPFWWKYGMNSDVIQYLKSIARKIKEGGAVADIERIFE
ncbi:MAG: radical SAM protein [Thermosipho sp. (in: Bacteria)]|nr:radical SAM protein [Thermosipho sp. (in: thermotogales)]